MPRSSAAPAAQPASGRAGRLRPSALFYPAAAIHGAFILLWSVVALTGAAGAPPALATPIGHAHEMLLGYGLAVVAGNQLPAQAPIRVVALFAVWLAARVAFLAAPGMPGTFDVAFAVAIAWQIAPRLVRAAKKLRNHALPAIVTGLAVAAIVMAVGSLSAGVDVHRIATVLVLLFAALMLFMGGRIIAPAAAGQLYRQGESLVARVQPRMEGAVLLGAAIAIAAFALDVESMARLACVAAGLLSLVRLLRWRLWRCRGRVDLLALGAGYAWLALGLIAIGAAPPEYRVAAQHLVTVGALGTLTFNVMATSALAKVDHVPVEQRLLAAGTLLIGAATVLRVLAASPAAPRAEALIAAAACWSAALTLLAWILLRPASQAWRRRGVAH